MNDKVNKKLSDEDFVNMTLNIFPPTQQGLTRRFKYRMTNRDIVKLNGFCGDLKGKNVLAASGSSIPLFSFLSAKNPPDFVYGFDYSPKQVAYNYLVKYAIKDLSFQEFKYFFGFDNKEARSKKNGEKRRSLLKQIPKKLRKYLTNDHELTKRDMKLIKCANCSFFSNETEYNLIKININKIKFFVFNLNISFGQDLRSLFCDNFFDFIYLSNVLDWICWHNTINTSNIDNILKMIGVVSKKNSAVVIDHLAKRVTLLSEYLKKSKVIDASSYNIYVYYWEMYKLKMGDE